MKLNLNVFLNSYNDSCQTSTPALSNFKWNREVNGIPFTAENSQMIQVPATSGSVTVLTSDSKKFLYIDTDQAISVIYNGGSPIAVNPFTVNGKLMPGVFMISGNITSLTITNSGASVANVFFAAMG